MKTTQKKGAIELSVTAIIVLILAIVMLGLGLGFIRGMFSKVSTQIEQQVATEPEPPIPSGSVPITLSRESIVTRAGDKEAIKVSTFNPTQADWAETSRPQLNCTDLNLTTSSNTKRVEQGKYETYTVLIDIPNKVPNTYLCQVLMPPLTKEYNKDFTIKITK